MTNENAKWEIREAMRKLIRRPTVIHVLPSVSKFKYVFTCRHCHNHTYTVLRLSGGWGADAAKVCSVCGNMGVAAERFWDQEMAWRNKARDYREARWLR